MKPPFSTSYLLSPKILIQLRITFLFFLFFQIQNVASGQILRDSFRFISTPVHPDLDQIAVYDCYQDKYGWWWLGTNKGLVRYDGTSTEVIIIKSEDSRTIKPFSITKTIKSKTNENLLYLCTEKDGLIEYDLLTGIGKNYHFQPNDSTGLNGIRVISLEEESNGNFWVCTDNFTLSYFDRKEKHFYHYSPTVSVANAKAGLLGEMVNCPIDSNYLWLASRFGLHRFDKQSREFENFFFEQIFEHYYIPRPFQLFADKQEKILWLGKSNLGLWRYNPKTGMPLSEGVKFSEHNAYNFNMVRGLFAYDKNTILVGERNIYEFNRQTGEPACANSVNQCLLSRLRYPCKLLRTKHLYAYASVLFFMLHS